MLNSYVKIDITGNDGKNEIRVSSLVDIKTPSDGHSDFANDVLSQIETYLKNTYPDEYKS